MPMFRSEDQYPNWCELEHFEVVRLNAGDEHGFARRGKVEKLIVGGGRCRLRVGAEEVEAATGANIDLVGAGSFEVSGGRGGGHAGPLLWTLGSGDGRLGHLQYGQ